MKNLGRDIGPSFYKIMLLDFVQEIRIPPYFVAKHKEYLSEKATIETYLSGKSWKVKIEEKHNEYWITEGWSNFVQEYGVNRSDFIVFRFISNSRIHVTVFGMSGCGKEASALVSDATECMIEESNYHDDDDADNDDGEYEELAELDATQKNKKTSFTFTWKKYMRNNMPIKGTFVRKNGLAKIKGVKLRNMKGDVHDVKLYHYTDQRSGFGGGWAAFVDKSNFILNETYKFEFIHEHGHILVQMSLIKKKNKERKKQRT